MKVTPDPSFVELARDTSQEHVDAVLADPAFREASLTKQLAAVMKRSKGSVNPRTVRGLLLAAAHPRPTSPQPKEHT